MSRVYVSILASVLLFMYSRFGERCTWTPQSPPARQTSCRIEFRRLTKVVTPKTTSQRCVCSRHFLMRSRWNLLRNTQSSTKRAGFTIYAILFVVVHHHTIPSPSSPHNELCIVSETHSLTWVLHKNHMGCWVPNATRTAPALMPL